MGLLIRELGKLLLGVTVLANFLRSSSGNRWLLVPDHICIADDGLGLKETQKVPKRIQGLPTFSQSNLPIYLVNSLSLINSTV